MDLHGLLDVLKPHGWQETDRILSEHGGLHRYVHVEGRPRTQWIDAQQDGGVSVWGGGLGGPRGTVMRVEDVLPFLRERGAM